MAVVVIAIRRVGCVAKRILHLCGLGVGEPTLVGIVRYLTTQIVGRGACRVSIVTMAVVVIAIRRVGCVAKRILHLCGLGVGEPTLVGIVRYLTTQIVGRGACRVSIVTMAVVVIAIRRVGCVAKRILHLCGLGVEAPTRVGIVRYLTTQTVDPNHRRQLRQHHHHLHRRQLRQHHHLHRRQLQRHLLHRFLRRVRMLVGIV